MLARPGFKSSEWMVALITAVLNIANSAGNWITLKQAIVASLPAIGYVISRGLAKTEPRGTSGSTGA